ncbi:hypothetical protein ACFV5N_05830 [Streptomyces sp. NPDC059853]|uniref:hypothetical protein n=1 Tax=Streptomyces sp. NPDC059853 TaxID=3346973 RepID=UPI003654529D
MSTPVDAEQAWTDLQRIRVTQERVYDEVERGASGGAGSAYLTAALMWLFLAGQGLEPPLWATLLALVVYVALLGALGVSAQRRSRMRLHHSRYDRRSLVTLLGGAAVTCAAVVFSGRLAEPLAPLTAGLIQATVSAGVFLLFLGPATRWSVGALRTRGARRADREEAAR